MESKNGLRELLDDRALARRHLLLGWLALLAFLSMGAALEAMHGLKMGLLLDASNETRRLMWTLAHAHGALLGLVNVAFGLTLLALPADAPLRHGWTSLCLIAATVLLPGGFFLGGLVIYSGDPSFGIFLVPLGALLLFVAVARTAWELLRRPGDPARAGADAEGALHSQGTAS